MSETAKLRHLLAPCCKGNGIDLGCGGDKIVPRAIGLDFLTAYDRGIETQHVGSDAIQLTGSALDLYWFKDSVLDYVYSSHLLEDFEDTKSILKEWVRVIKNNGYLVLNLPHDKKFFEHCCISGQAYNADHKIKDMSIEYMRKVVDELNMEQLDFKIEEVMYTDIKHIYCFGVVYKIIKK